MDRIVVSDEIYDDVFGAVKMMVESLCMGPGLNDHDITPLVSENQLERVAIFAGIGAQQGARLISGGRKVDRLP